VNVKENDLIFLYEKNCLEYVLSYLFFYNGVINLNDILYFVWRYYPVRCKKQTKEELVYKDVVLILTKWHHNGYVFYDEDLNFYKQPKFFNYFVGELR
jgi:hypothetical protein